MRFIRSFETLSLDDVPLVGGKNASLGEMVQTLGGQGVRVPGGFATRAEESGSSEEGCDAAAL